MSGLANLKVATEPSTSDRISDQIRQLIVDGSLEPGERISESKLAAQLGISRSPVREALQTLVRQRLLVTAPNKTMVVARFTTADIHEIYEARQAIESHAGLRLINQSPALRQEACDQLEPILDELGRALRTGDRLQVSRIDLKFHTAFVAAVGNGRLLEAYTVLSAESLACINSLEIAYPSGADLVQDHQQLIDLLLAGDGNGLTKAIEDHLALAARHLSETRSNPPAQSLKID